MFDNAFNRYGLKNPKAMLIQYLPTIVRVCDTPGSKVQTHYILLVAKKITDANGQAFCTATLPGRTLRPWLDEYRYDAQRGLNRFGSRLGANNILNEVIGTDTNKMEEIRQNEVAATITRCSQRAATTKSGIDVNQRTLTLNKPIINALYLRDLQKLGRDQTGTLHPGAETVFNYVNLRLSRSGLPAIEPIQTLSDVPKHLTSKNIPSINAVRTQAQWFKLANVISGIRQNFSGNPFADHTQESRPQFRLEGIRFDAMKELTDQTTYIEPPALYGLILLAKSGVYRSMFKTKVTNPETKQEWISVKDIKDHLVETNSKTYNMMKNKFTHIPNLGHP
ncbi:MAG: hypothetical protein PHD48_08910 [Alphaproteobacteria bacterium]|nr:hypothetical protein [Alphaproteobacteria bacterium]